VSDVRHERLVLHLREKDGLAGEAVRVGPRVEHSLESHREARLGVDGLPDLAHTPSPGEALQTIAAGDERVSGHAAFKIRTGPPPSQATRAIHAPSASCSQRPSPSTLWGRRTHSPTRNLSVRPRRVLGERVDHGPGRARRRDPLWPSPSKTPLDGMSNPIPSFAMPVEPNMACFTVDFWKRAAVNRTVGQCHESSAARRAVPCACSHTLGARCRNPPRRGSLPPGA
jgi:hypothetical protein